MKRYFFFIILLAAAGVILTSAFAQEKTASENQQKKGKDQMTQKKEIAVVETSMGTFEIELYGADAPKTVENFVGLAKKKYFDGMRIHRVAKGFVVQTGDDKSKDTTLVGQWGTGGQSLWGKDFEDELNPEAPSYKEGYKKGVVAMANRGKNTNSSQFFVCLKDISLPHSYTIFGKVVQGMEVVDKIGAVDIIPGQMGPNDGRPKQHVIVKKIHLKK